MKKHKVIKTVLVIEIIILIGVIGVAWLQESPSAKKELRKLYYDAMSMVETVTSQDKLEDKMQQLVETNAEAKEFVDHFPNREAYIGKEIDLSQDVKEGEIPYFLQWDMRWGYEDFGSSNIGLSGCGPTCMSMAYVYFTGDLTGNPRKMAEFCRKEGFYTDQGTSWDYWTAGAEKLGLNGKELALDEGLMKAALDAGSIIVCSMWPGDFTTTGHYILVRDYDSVGFLLNDPNSRKNSEKVWSYDTLKGQIRNLWIISKKSF